MRQSVFIFVPGSNDPGLSDCLPRPPIPSSLLSTFIIQKLPNWRFVSNPCRMTLFSQEIVIFRSDLTSRLMRHAIREPKQNLPEQTVKTILSQSHLAPFPQRISPIFWGWDHALERIIEFFPWIRAIIFIRAPLIKILVWVCRLRISIFRKAAISTSRFAYFMWFARGLQSQPFWHHVYQSFIIQ